MRHLKALGFVLIASVALAAPGQHEQHQHAGGTPERVGQVHFPVSCSAEAQKQFDRAVAMLHSFWYENAEEAFAGVTTTDPSCAMGYWGIAMSLVHPLWAPATDPVALKKGLAAVERAKSLGAKTERERDYIAAIDAFYKDPDQPDVPTRLRAFEKAMEQVHFRHPEDREAAVFYALSLISTAPPTDKTYANQKKAAELLGKVFAVEPDHPGVTHYFIHAYDSPPLAGLALDAARRYAKIAPSVPHALHMPSHIFTRLGLWQDSIESNLASAAAAKDYETKMQMNGAWHQRLHPMDYLEYAYLQGAQDREARRILEETQAIQSADPAPAAAYALTAIPARYAIERCRWSEAASLTVHPESFTWNRFRWAEANIYFARALGKARSGDVAGAHKDVEKLQSLHEELAAAKDSYWADQVEIQRRAATAWLARAEGKNAEALTLMRSAADLEDSTEKNPVTPGPIVPARELLGDLLLELGQPAAALNQFETSLRAAPNRFNGLYGAARAAELSGNREKAQSFYAKLMAVSEHADGERPELRQAKTFPAKK